MGKRGKEKEKSGEKRRKEVESVKISIISDEEKDS